MPARAWHDPSHEEAETPSRTQRYRKIRSPERYTMWREGTPHPLSHAQWPHIRSLWTTLSRPVWCSTWHFDVGRWTSWPEAELHESAGLSFWFGSADFLKTPWKIQPEHAEPCWVYWAAVCVVLLWIICSKERTAVGLILVAGTRQTKAEFCRPLAEMNISW